MITSKINRYLIVGYSRSGTTVTHLALMGHPNVAALVGELRPAPYYTQGIKTFTGGYCTEKEQKHGFRAIFDAITSIHATEDTLALGAKTACNSPTLAREIVYVLQNFLNDMRVIHVVRRDLVAQYGSALSGKKSGVMHSWSKGAEQRKIENIRINKWPFVRYALWNFEMYSVLKKLHDSHAVYELYYEDYVQSPDKIHRELFDFIGVPYREAVWLNSKKVMPAPEAYITNYHEMRRMVAMLERQYADGAISPYVEYMAKAANKLQYLIDLSRDSIFGKSEKSKKSGSGTNLQS